MIISNNVEPKSLEIEIVGDVYGFNKELKYGSNNNEIFVDLPLYKDDNHESKEKYTTTIK